MTRTRIGAAPALVALALLLALPAGSSGDSSSPTWAGTWDTDFGQMTLDAGGSGNYVSPNGPNSSGTISGNVDGRVNTGEWKQPNSSGTFTFAMSGDGLSFTGDWQYDGGGCGSACGWNGACVDGACRENDDPPPAQPPPCGTAAMNALAARKGCDLGLLPFDSEVSVPGPGRGETVDISPKAPKATAEEVLAAIRELLLEEEEAEIFGAIAIELGAARGSEAISGCLLMGEIVLGGKGSVGGEHRAALVRACSRLLLDEVAKLGMGSTAATDGCKAVFVPAFPKGEKVTKRMRKRAAAAARERIAASCKQRRVGRLSFSVRARNGMTLNEVTARRLRVKIARGVPRSAPKQRLGVRWRAKR